MYGVSSAWPYFNLALDVLIHLDPEEKKKQQISCSMTHFGKKNGDTSMSQTVSYPIAIAVKLVRRDR